MIMKRDAQVIKFVEQYKAARTSTLVMFYPSYQVAARRLSAIVEAGELRRERDGWNGEYIYYIKKPKQLRHALTVTDFYRELSKQAEIKKFIVEPALGNIRPDAVIGFVQGGQSKLALLEVELSNKGFDADKYSRFDWQRHFPVKPDLFVVTDKKVPKLDYNTHVFNTGLQFDF